jgi:hypothetical protein
MAAVTVSAGALIHMVDECTSLQCGCLLAGGATAFEELVTTWVSLLALLHDAAEEAHPAATAGSSAPAQHALPLAQVASSALLGTTPFASPVAQAVAVSAAQAGGVATTAMMAHAPSLESLVIALYPLQDR